MPRETPNSRSRYAAPALPRLESPDQSSEDKDQLEIHSQKSPPEVPLRPELFQAVKELAISSPVDAILPDPWKVLPINKPNEAPSLAFLRVAPDNDNKQKLNASVTLPSIRITSDYAPGLIESTFFPVPFAMTPAAVASGDFFDGSSRWIQQRLLELDTRDRHRLKSLTIGPVIALQADSWQAVRQEIQAATQRPQLSLLRDHIFKTALPSDQAALRTWLQDLRKQSPAGIVSDFLDAMLWRLRQPR